MRPKPLVLIILDGWGYAPPSPANAISLARKPNYDKLLADFPNTLIHTSGRYVGLPPGQMGNSEVGHLNMGAGRVVYMDITKIDLMIENGEFQKNPVLVDAMIQARTGDRRLHLFGLLSDGGVHSHSNHLYALLRMAKQNGVNRVFVHCFMDGRDTLPTNGAMYIEQLQQKMREYNVGKIASVSGRYYAMDRDKKWDREKKAFDAMVFGDAEGGPFTDPVQGVKESYNRGITDEFIIPFVVVDSGGEPVGTVRDGDVCINFNFRADRARQITRCLARNSHFTAQDGAELEGAAELDAIIPRANWLSSRLPTSRRTRAVMRMEPGSATLSSRAASTTGIPWQSWATKCTSPALAPIRSMSRSRSGERGSSARSPVGWSRRRGARPSPSRTPPSVRRPCSSRPTHGAGRLLLAGHGRGSRPVGRPHRRPKHCAAAWSRRGRTPPPSPWPFGPRASRPWSVRRSVRQ